MIIAATRFRSRRLQCAAALFAVASSALAAPSLEELVTWPSQRLSPKDAITVRPDQFLAVSQTKKWQEDLDRRGLRATGSPAHEAYTNALYDRLEAVGVQDLHYESVTLERWTTETWSLAEIKEAEVVPLDAASYIPYSGVTPAEGITAPLVMLRSGAKPGRDLAGKIVLVEVLPSGILTKGLIKLVGKSAYDPGRQMKLLTPYRRPFMYLEEVTKIQEALEKVGAAGMIVVTDRPNNYRPYDRVLRHVPGLYVGVAHARELQALVARNGLVRLTLPATVTTVKTRNLLGVIPGASSEFIALNSHTDGTNGIEDNGPNAIVNIAQYLTRLPKNALPRSVLIMLSSGHMAAGVGIEGFLQRHATDGLLDRIGAVVTIEHLGAREWLPNAQGALAPTGNFELGILFLPEISALMAAGKKWLISADAGPGSVMFPLKPHASGKADDSVWPGEGQYFWGQGKIPTINYITGPYYLLDWGATATTADKIDYQRLHRETVAFTQMVLDLTRIPMANLRGEKRSQ